MIFRQIFTARTERKEEKKKKRRDLLIEMRGTFSLWWHSQFRELDVFRHAVHNDSSPHIQSVKKEYIYMCVCVFFYIFIRKRQEKTWQKEEEKKIDIPASKRARRGKRERQTERRTGKENASTSHREFCLVRFTGQLFVSLCFSSLNIWINFHWKVIWCRETAWASLENASTSILIRASR